MANLLRILLMVGMILGFLNVAFGSTGTTVRPRVRMQESYVEMQNRHTREYIKAREQYIRAYITMMHYGRYVNWGSARKVSVNRVRSTREVAQEQRNRYERRFSGTHIVWDRGTSVSK